MRQARALLPAADSPDSFSPLTPASPATPARVRALHGLPSLAVAANAPLQDRATPPVAVEPATGGYRARYEALHAALRADAGSGAGDGFLPWLRAQLAEAEALPCSLPDSVEGLEAWMLSGAEEVGRQYQQYLAERRAGAPRRFFANRSHALAFLRGVAPTKLVDGSWLYGLVRHWRNPRLADLVRTYVEELGHGRADRNHVLLYRQLLATHGQDDWQDLPDDHYRQGALQMALALNADVLLPEVIGFNLGYEQLPLHLPITAYELNELGIDPYYFTLHVTVDNAATGHARRAVQAVRDALPRMGDVAGFWRRVRAGYQLNGLGVGTNAVIRGFDLQAELERILARKSVVGHGAHGDYCRLGGRTVNDWLSSPDNMPAFMRVLEAEGWIVRNAEPRSSRFWRLLEGDHAEMFGVFGPYEMQVLQDWLRGPAAVDGAPVQGAEGTDAAVLRRPRSFRAQQRLQARQAGGGLSARRVGSAAELDPDVDALEALLRGEDAAASEAALVRAMAPDQHWMPAGLLATRHFARMAGMEG